METTENLTDCLHSMMNGNSILQALRTRDAAKVNGDI